MEQFLSSESHLSPHRRMQQALVRMSLVATAGCCVQVQLPSKSCVCLLLALG